MKDGVFLMKGHYPAIRNDACNNKEAYLRYVKNHSAENCK